MNWYVVNTHSGYENKAKLALEDAIARADLAHKFGVVHAFPDLGISSPPGGVLGPRTAGCRAPPSPPPFVPIGPAALQMMIAAPPSRWDRKIHKITPQRPPSHS